MAHHHDVSKCLARFVTRMRDRVSDDICAARIERYLAKSALEDGHPSREAAGETDPGINEAVARMDALTRGILILVVSQKMSVSEVARRFRMSEERVCRHFRRAVEMVAMGREDGSCN
ncbi:sigma-70 RNA polymerase sigma factor region 4 domain-containing protein [Sphingobium yanoikuyae]|uniref:sigma factor-like helix-turn-helix DNA-binding protein n=1 Tax=Sphingobium yanoikuyae TaxID=13690 RepID=UPI00084773FA|nr:sigma factor-like helix-turn-helix DNA-binding protein [Sphingobium yanoikuyae]MDV3482713.1 sigma factor-like helix-turn-helix DNA-binding protein [Sphingobium yanoikuyae]